MSARAKNPYPIELQPSKGNTLFKITTNCPRLSAVIKKYVVHRNGEAGEFPSGRHAYAVI